MIEGVGRGEKWGAGDTEKEGKWGRRLELMAEG